MAIPCRMPIPTVARAQISLMSSACHLQATLLTFNRRSPKSGVLRIAFVGLIHVVHLEEKNIAGKRISAGVDPSEETYPRACQEGKKKKWRSCPLLAVPQRKAGSLDGDPSCWASPLAEDRAGIPSSNRACRPPATRRPQGPSDSWASSSKSRSGKVARSELRGPKKKPKGQKACCCLASLNKPASFDRRFCKGSRMVVYRTISRKASALGSLASRASNPSLGAVASEMQAVLYIWNLGHVLTGNLNTLAIL